MTEPTKHVRFLRWIATSLVAVAFVVGVVVLMLWLTGTFGSKVDDRTAARGRSGPIGRAVGDGRLVEVVHRTMPLEETAIGTIQPVHRVELASRLLARVIEADVIAGRKVATGDVLVRLEETDLGARLAQSESAVAQAQAALDQARLEESRARSAFDKGALSGIEMERAVNALKGADANLARLEQARTEARTILEYATIRSTIDGVVVDKRVDTGDTVSPGQVVVTLLDPTRMQLVASVRESLSRRLRVGQSVSVKVDMLDHACAGTVSEIVPEAESTSRTFQVKVTGPCPEGAYSGMFGRLSIPVGEEEVLLIPSAAVRTVGQLDCVDVAVDGMRQRRATRLGRIVGDEVEVLSGLAAGEWVVVDADATKTTAAGGRGR
ncbi:MAG: efflux RND transporter periplasmic adaptor subunit [Phycisphaerales bacterium]